MSLGPQPYRAALHSIGEFPAVGVLFAHGYPRTIFGSVGPVIVDPLQIKPRRTRRHVRMKINEITPAVADRNPTSTVVREVLVLGVSASLHHALPHRIERIAVEPVSVSRHTFFGHGLTVTRSNSPKKGVSS